MQKASALCRVRHKTHIERIGGRETLLHPDMRSKNFITHLAPTSGILLSAGASSSHRSVVHSRRRSAQRCFQVLDLRHSHIFPSFFFLDASTFAFFRLPCLLHLFVPSRCSFTVLLCSLDPWGKAPRNAHKRCVILWRWLSLSSQADNLDMQAGLCSRCGVGGGAWVPFQKKVGGCLRQDPPLAEQMAIFQKCFSGFLFAPPPCLSE